MHTDISTEIYSLSKRAKHRQGSITLYYNHMHAHTQRNTSIQKVKELSISHNKLNN